MENKMVKQILFEGFGTSRKGEDIRKRCRRVNVVKYYVFLYENGKMRLLKLFQE
jgi:hypothetical protein